MQFFRIVAAVLITAIVTSGVWIVSWPMLIERDGWFREMAGLAPISGIESGATLNPPEASATVAGSLIERGVLPAANGLVIPVSGVPLSELGDSFNDARGGGVRLHQALDIAAPAGTPVVAAAPGTVAKLFVSDDGGNTVYVRSADRQTIYYYAHLQGYAANLREGQVVAAGDALGTVGTSGNAEASGPHLHFAVTRVSPHDDWSAPGEPVNPFALLTGK